MCACDPFWESSIQFCYAAQQIDTEAEVLPAGKDVLGSADWQGAAVGKLHLAISKFLHQLCPHAPMGGVLEQIFHFVGIALQIIKFSVRIILGYCHPPALRDERAQARSRR